MARLTFHNGVVPILSFLIIYVAFFAAFGLSRAVSRLTSGLKRAMRHARTVRSRSRT
jgi:hypothetical protein